MPQEPDPLEAALEQAMNPMRQWGQAVSRVAQQLVDMKRQEFYNNMYLGRQPLAPGAPLTSIDQEIARIYDPQWISSVTPDEAAKTLFTIDKAASEGNVNALMAKDEIKMRLIREGNATELINFWSEPYHQKDQTAQRLAERAAGLELTPPPPPVLNPVVQPVEQQGQERSAMPVVTPRNDGGSRAEWLDADGKPHRDGAPAVIQYDAEGNVTREEWWQHGQQHRDDGPAKTTFYPEGGRDEAYYVNGKLHRDGKPAWTIYREDGSKDKEYYFHNGKRDRADGPAWTNYDENGLPSREYWYKDGQQHREDGPAITDYVNGQPREEAYYVSGQLHRVDGPARISYNEDGSIKEQLFYLEGVRQDDLAAQDREEKQRLEAESRELENEVQATGSETAKAQLEDKEQQAAYADANATYHEEAAQDAYYGSEEQREDIRAANQGVASPQEVDNHAQTMSAFKHPATKRGNKIRSVAKRFGRIPSRERGKEAILDR